MKTGFTPFALLAIVLSLLAGIAQAQVTYAFRNDTFAYDTPSASAGTVTWNATGVAPACTNYPQGDDDWADVAFPGGFGFTFAGVSRSSVRIYSNGILAFGNDVSGFHRDYTPQALPITAAAGFPSPSGTTVIAGCPNAVPVNLMLPYWIDIVAGTANSTAGASVRHELLGTAPNRRFVISWANVKLHNTTTRYNFQVALYESASGVNGNFHFRYTSGSSDGTNAAVGVQLSTTDFTQYSSNQQFIDTDNGTAILWHPANQLATKGAEYRFDEGVWSGAAGEVRDTSGNSQHATRVGGASSVAGGRLCRGGSFTNNTSNTTIDAVATPVVPGATGSAGFWYRSANAWNAAPDTMLLDATTVANRPFFFMKRSTGALRFAVSDSAGTTITANTANQTFAANTWQHVGVTWSIKPGTNQTVVQIFINGNLANVARGTTNGTPAAFASLHIGDNRTSGVTPANGTPNGANGIIDEVYIYPLDVSSAQFQADMALTRPTCTYLDHFRISHGGTASSCAPASITIAAHDPSHALFSQAGAIMTVSTSTGLGTWSAITAINPVVNTGSGTATYTFSNESNVVLGLSHPAGTVNINVNQGGISESSGAASPCTAPDYSFGTVCDANLVFSPCVSNFECMESGLAYNNLVTSPTLRNPLYTKLSGTASTFDVIAVDAGGNRVTNYAADADKTVTVELVDGAGSIACASRAVLTPAVSTSLTFARTSQPTEQGRKPVSFTVNQARPNLRCRVTDANQTPSVVGCSSDNFAIRPQRFTLSTTTPLNPVAPSTNKLAAGEDFNLTANPGVTVGYTGTPVINTALVQDHNAAAAGVLNGSFGAATGGSATGVFQYHDVGTITFTADAVTDAGFTSVDQASSDCVTVSTSNTAVSGKFGCTIGSAALGPLGRFHPHHFAVNSSFSATGCGGTSGFTYMDHDALGIVLNITAQSKNDATTTRYASPASAHVPLATLGLTLLNGASPTDLLSRLSQPSVPARIWASGNYSADNTYRFDARNAVPPLMDGPYDSLRLRLTVTDATDGVQVTRLNGTPVAAVSSIDTPTTARVRYGRLVLSNAHGSDLLALAMPFQAQYWTGSAWATNTLDSCTDIATALVFVKSPAGLPSPTGGAVAAGKGSLNFAAPNQKGSVEVCAAIGPDADHPIAACRTVAGTALPWLQGNWDANNQYDDNPAARATFGIHPGRTPIIYRRERY